MTSKLEYMAAAEDLYNALKDLVVDLEEVGQDGCPETGEIYETHKAARAAMEKYEELIP